MKKIITLIVLTLPIFGCVNKQTPKDDKIIMSDTKKNSEKTFDQIANFPTIKDSMQFISDLRKTFNLKILDSPKSKEIEKISFYKKVKLYGSDREYYFIEYDYGVGDMASYPWKYQLLLTSDGKLIKILTGQRFDFIEIFPNQNPFLMTVTVTARGNGGHEIYKISNDTLENVYEGYYDYNLKTVNAGYSLTAFEPVELKLMVKDFNNDGINDISFNGNLLYLFSKTKEGSWYDAEIIDGKTVPYTYDNPAKKTPIEFIFLYDKKTGHFKAKENYKNKFGLNDL